MAATARKRAKEWPEVLTKEEAADFLRCSAATIQRLTRQGWLKPYHIGQRPRYPLAMLQRFVEQESSDDHAATT